MKKREALMLVLCCAQGDAGGPIMCKQDGSWFQAAVLTLPPNSSTAPTRAAPVMVFTKMSVYEKFLTETLGSFLSPASDNVSSATPTSSTTTRGGACAHAHFFYLHVFILCLMFWFFMLWQTLIINWIKPRAAFILLHQYIGTVSTYFSIL